MDRAASEADEPCAMNPLYPWLNGCLPGPRGSPTGQLGVIRREQRIAMNSNYKGLNRIPARIGSHPASQYPKADDL